MRIKSPIGASVFQAISIAGFMALVVQLSPLAPAQELGKQGGDWLTRAVQYLASDELEGRGLETQGLGRAAVFVRDELLAAGVELLSSTDQGFQYFPFSASSKLGPDNRLELVAPGESAQSSKAITLALDKDYTPLAMSGSGEIDLPLVFVGYGISAPDLAYDDFAGVDVEGKAVVVLRHEPQQANPHSKFDGSENSRHAPLSAKISAAYQRGAAAIVFCTDQFEINKRRADAQKRLDTAMQELEEAKQQPDSQSKSEETAKARELVERWQSKASSDQDELLPFTAGEASSPREIAVFHCRRESLDNLLAAASQSSLAEFETQIDQVPQPHSFEIPGARIRANVAIERKLIQLANIVGVIPGKGPLAEETIVVGAHYDHLGRGEAGSAEPDSKQIHNGADDNASGAVVLIEVARQLAKREFPSVRKIVFVAFSGEERGLLGSAHFVRECPVPLESIVAMVNFDMVGRLSDNKLIASGFDTATQFEKWLEETNEHHRFDVSKQSGGFGPSDHATFYAKQIPVVHFFTGAHSDYHKPTDDFHLLNLEGMRRVSDFAVDWVTKLATVDGSIDYQQVDQPSQTAESKNPRPYFGSIPDFGGGGTGYAISGVAPGSPADDAGLKGGDAIVMLGPHRIGNLEDFDNALRKFEAGDKVPIVFTRGDQQIESAVILDPPR
ncbi:MAG: M28 family peptidase [Planctomycetales bacterium]|nr:M28 family peptidase [Planctomycetales bacterium]